MSFFDDLKLAGLALRNMQAVNRLNDESDSIISKMTGLPSRAITKEARSFLYEKVKQLYLDNTEEDYQAIEIAALKLIHLKQWELPPPFGMRVEQALSTLANQICSRAPVRSGWYLMLYGHKL